MRTRQRRLEEMMLDGASEDALYDVPTLAYEPDAGAVDPNLVRPMLDDYLNADAPPSPVQVTPEFTPPDDDDAWIGEMASRYEDPVSKRGYGSADNSKAGDGGYSQAVADSEGYDWTSAIQGFIDPANVQTYRKQADERRQRPIKNWQEGQRLAQERRRNDENEAYRRDSLEARREAQQGSLDARNRGLDIREDVASTPEERAALVRLRAEEQMRVNAAREPGKNRRAAMVSGRRDVMENEGVLGAEVPRRVEDMNAPADLANAEADSFVQDLSIDGVLPPPHIMGIIDQLRNPNLSDRERTRANARLQHWGDTHRARNEEATAHIGEERRQSKLPQTIAAVDQAIGNIERHRDPESGDIPGMSRVDRALEGVPVLDSANKLIEGDEGASVRSSIALLRESLKRLNSGAAVAGHEMPNLNAVIAMDWTSSPDAILAAVRDWRNRLTEQDMEIIQSLGVAGGETYAGRRPGAQRVAPTLQPGQSVDRGGRRFTVVP